MTNDKPTEREEAAVFFREQGLDVQVAESGALRMKREKFIRLQDPDRDASRTELKWIQSHLGPHDRLVSVRVLGRWVDRGYAVEGMDIGATLFRVEHRVVWPGEPLLDGSRCVELWLRGDHECLPCFSQTPLRILDIGCTYEHEQILGILEAIRPVLEAADDEAGARIDAPLAR